jgi:hypothetical protein
MKLKVLFTTRYCDVVKEWVSILVYKDGTTKCAYFSKYISTESIQKGKKTQSKKGTVCKGPPCALCNSYKEEVFNRYDKVA